MKDFPFVGYTMDGFVVEQADVCDTPHGSRHYTYSVRTGLHGPGGDGR